MSVSTSSTLSKLHQLDGSYLTYCRPTGDGNGCSHLLSLKFIDEDHDSLTSHKHSLTQQMLYVLKIAISLGS